MKGFTCDYCETTFFTKKEVTPVCCPFCHLSKPPAATGKVEPDAQTVELLMRVTVKVKEVIPEVLDPQLVPDAVKGTMVGLQKEGILVKGMLVIS